MKIYTKTGDTGQTGLYGGLRVSKADLRLETYGTVDELNSHLGLLASLTINASRKALLIEVQHDLFVIGSHLASDSAKKASLKLPTLEADLSEKLETAIDQWDAQLPAMTHFILPGGHKEVAQAHIARTVCRRAERITVALSEVEAVDSPVLVYLNRLSDFLFVLARIMGHDLGAEEVSWIARK